MRGDFSVFRKSLLCWFDQHKRDLPWRRDPTLYKTVVSEFMLQQTQVDTVQPYFHAWLKEFPDFEGLAQASEARVLKRWEGLGYYSRARNLHKLARSIVEEGVPESPSDWLTRPGVGPYTAAAISSIAQGLPEPVIDGNVIRVLSRINNDDAPVRSSAEAQKRFLPFARELIDANRPGHFNEALMELGATVCRKARPACLICPVRAHCAALAAGTAESLPVIPRKTTTRREVHRLWLVRKNQLLLLVHPDNATRLAGLAELPLLSRDPGTKPLLTRSRGISSERIREHIHALPPAHPLIQESLSLQNTQWVPIATLDNLSLSAPHKRWIAHLLSHP